MDPTRPSRCLAALLAASAVLSSARVSAAPAPSPESQSLAEFEAGFKAGQAQFDGGEFLAAARTWIEAADKLRETTANRSHRIAVYEYVVDAYMRGLESDESTAPLREAVTALEGYCDRFTRAYGTETPISAKIVEARDKFKARLEAAEAREKVAAQPTEPEPTVPEPTTPPPPPPWKGLAIGGGVLIGLGVGAGALAAAGAARGASLTKEFDDPANMCVLGAPVGACADYYDGGKAANAMAIAGAVAAPLLIGAGVGLLVVGLKRRGAPRQAVAPVLAPGLVGLGWRGSF